MNQHGVPIQYLSRVLGLKKVILLRIKDVRTQNMIAYVGSKKFVMNILAKFVLLLWMTIRTVGMVQQIVLRQDFFVVCHRQMQKLRLMMSGYLQSTTKF